MTTQILLAGSGGQGILFAGKFLTYAGMMDGKEVSWLPSYGPEMRGGTANCSVILSDEPVGSPMVLHPDVLVAMNLPSFRRFEPEIVPGGMLIADSTLISDTSSRSDIKAFYLPATQVAYDESLKGLANMIMIGKVLKETGIISDETVRTAMAKVIPAGKTAMLELNLRAIALGAAA